MINIARGKKERKKSISQNPKTLKKKKKTHITMKERERERERERKNENKKINKVREKHKLKWL